MFTDGNTLYYMVFSWGKFKKKREIQSSKIGNYFYLFIQKLKQMYYWSIPINLNLSRGYKQQYVHLVVSTGHVLEM